MNQLISLFDLTGKTALVTGGGGVLGSAMARALAKAGAHVVVSGRTRATLERAVENIQQDGGSAAWVEADVTQAEAFGEAIAPLGQIDILINAAGGNHMGAMTSPTRSLFQLEWQAMESVMQLNWMGTIIPSFAVAQQMAERGEGVIINIASMTTFKPLSRTIAYSSAKAAVGSFTQWLSSHLAMHYSPRIRVNAIAPGFFLTEINRTLLFDVNKNEPTPRGQSIINHTPMGRFGEADELGGTTVWLASAASQFVTGVVVAVDGGFQAYEGV